MWEKRSPNLQMLVPGSICDMIKFRLSCIDKFKLLLLCVGTVTVCVLESTTGSSGFLFATFKEWFSLPIRYCSFPHKSMLLFRSKYALSFLFCVGWFCPQKRLHLEQFTWAIISGCFISESFNKTVISHTRAHAKLFMMVLWRSCMFYSR